MYLQDTTANAAESKFWTEQIMEQEKSIAALTSRLETIQLQKSLSLIRLEEP